RTWLRALAVLMLYWVRWTDRFGFLTSKEMAMTEVAGSGADGSVISAVARQRIEELLPRYARKRSVLLPALWIVQNEIGWLPSKAMEEVAEILEIEPVQVEETASFYSLFFKK